MLAETEGQSYACPSVGLLRTPKSEVAGEDVKPRVGHKDCGVFIHVLSGLPAFDFDASKLELYFSGYEAYKELKKCVPDCSLMQSGTVTSHVCTSSRCYFVVELHSPVNCHALSIEPPEVFDSVMKMIWFTVSQSDASFINTLVRDKLRYLIQPVRFHKGVGKYSSNYTDASFHQQEKMCVNVISADGGELKGMLPGIGAQSVSTVCNALKVSQDIRLGITSRNGNAEELIGRLARELLSIYDVDAQDNHQSCVDAPPPEAQVLGVHDICSNSRLTSQGFELQSIVQVDDNCLDEIKPHIHAKSEKKEVNVDFSPFIKSVECEKNKKKMLPNKEKNEDSKPMPRISVERRLLLECPLCGMPFRSCKNRYQTLVSHIKRRHSDCQKRLLKIVHMKYVVDS